MITLAAVVEVQSDGLHQDAESNENTPHTFGHLKERGIGHSERIAEAASHLRVALLQIEDEIVKQHVSEALKLLEEK